MDGETSKPNPCKPHFFPAEPAAFAALRAEYSARGRIPFAQFREKKLPPACLPADMQHRSALAFPPVWLRSFSLPQISPLPSREKVAHFGAFLREYVHLQIFGRSSLPPFVFPIFDGLDRICPHLLINAGEAGLHNCQLSIVNCQLPTGEPRSTHAYQSCSACSLLRGFVAASRCPARAGHAVSSRQILGRTALPHTYSVMPACLLFHKNFSPPASLAFGNRTPCRREHFYGQTALHARSACWHTYSKRPCSLILDNASTAEVTSSFL